MATGEGPGFEAGLRDGQFPVKAWRSMLAAESPLRMPPKGRQRAATRFVGVEAAQAADVEVANRAAEQVERLEHVDRRQRIEDVEVQLGVLGRGLHGTVAAKDLKGALQNRLRDDGVLLVAEKRRSFQDVRQLDLTEAPVWSGG